MTIDQEVRFIQDGKASFICDGQFGSTGKGLLAAYLASMECNRVDFATTNASANAGHTTKFADGRKFITYHLPTFGVIQPKSHIYLNAGSIIDPHLLAQEVKALDIDPARISIHPMAAVINGVHKAREADPCSPTHKISSTQKGVGAALADKIMRTAKVAKDCPYLAAMGCKTRIIELNNLLRMGDRVSVEVPQGFSLGINERFYPFCTSRQCTMMQGMSDANIHPKYMGKTAMAIRTYPIRVGSLPNSDGSGSSYPDQREITWEDLNVEPEITTVTGRVRRVFTFSWEQFREAYNANEPDLVFLNFVNYDVNIAKRIVSMSKEVGLSSHFIFGHGPNVEDVRTTLY